VSLSAARLPPAFGCSSQFRTSATKSLLLIATGALIGIAVHAQLERDTSVDPALVGTANDDNPFGEDDDPFGSANDDDPFDEDDASNNATEPSGEPEPPIARVLNS
jgi:hypothetical protein